MNTALNASTSFSDFRESAVESRFLIFFQTEEEELCFCWFCMYIFEFIKARGMAASIFGQ